MHKTLKAVLLLPLTIFALPIFVMLALIFLVVHAVSGAPFYVTKDDVRVAKYVRFKRVPLDKE